jgi:hypothetical protein
MEIKEETIWDWGNLVDGSTFVSQKLLKSKV